MRFADTLARVEMPAAGESLAHCVSVAEARVFIPVPGIADGIFAVITETFFTHPLALHSRHTCLQDGIQVSRRRADSLGRNHANGEMHDGTTGSGSW